MKLSRLFSWFSRRSYAQKFTIIGLLFVVSLAGFYPMGRDQLERRENYGVNELEGTLYLRPLQALLADLNKHQILALRAVNDPDAADELAAQQAIINEDLTELAELDEKYRESLQLDIELKTIQDAWQVVLEATEKQSPFEIDAKHFQIYAHIRRAITRIGNTSFLILDPDLDTYYMMDIVLLRMPEFQDLLNQITLVVATADMQGNPSEGDRLELINLSSEISSYLVRLRSSNKVSWENDETGRMRQLTDPTLNGLEAQLSAFIKVLNEQIILPDRMNLTSEHLDAAEATQAAATAYYDSVSQALEYGINGRIQEYTDRVTFAILFALLITSVALLIGFLLMRAISRPLAELAVAAGRLGAGERDVHIPVTGVDEVGQVGLAFNTMVSELEVAQEKQENQLIQLTQLTKSLETSANVSRRLSTILDPSQLMEAVVTEVQRAFSYYHAHIYLYDEAEENLVIAGGTGEAGEAMLSSGHKLALGQGLVGKAAVTNAPVLVPDVSKEPGWLPNELLPETKAEAAIPIVLGDQVLGVLDVQHNVIGGLDAESVALLQSVANQVAIALQNARQYQQTQESEARTQTILASVNIPVMISKASDGTFFYFNDPALEMIGLTRDQLTGRPSLNFYDNPADREKFVSLLREHGNVDNYEVKLKRITGEPYWALLTARTINFQGEPAIITTMLDINVQREAQEVIARRATEMETVADVGTVTTTILEPDRLLREAVNLIKSRFDLYHAHIHLLNDNKDTLVLTAGAGEIGQKMVAEGRRIPLAANGSLVATAARTRQGAIRNYDSPGEGFMPHPLLAETRCEMAVPIALGGEVLGILDVRSDQLNYFNEADMQTYATLAAQVAVALQNARSFTRSEQALKELSELSRRLTREGWESYLDQTSEDLRLTYDLQQVIKGKGENDSEEMVSPMLVQQIAVLGESVGQISLVEPRALVDDAAEIVAAVAERLSAHLENLRLELQMQNALNETELRTEELAVLNEMSQSLTAQTTVDGVFQTVYDYLSRLMDTTDFFTALYDEESDEVVFALTALGKELHWYTERRQAEDGVTEYVIRQRQPLLMSENVMLHLAEIGVAGTGDIPESWLGVPILLGDRVLGVIGVESYTTPRLYNEQHLNLLTAVANQAAIAIESTRLLEGTVALAEEEQILRQITTRVGAAIDTESILRTAAEEIGRALGLEGYVSLESAGSTNGTNGSNGNAAHHNEND